jgi:hypothetical protein
VGGGARVLAEGPEQKRRPQRTPSGRKERGREGGGCLARTRGNCGAGFADCQGLGAVEKRQVVGGSSRGTVVRGGAIGVRLTLTAPSPPQADREGTTSWPVEAALDPPAPGLPRATAGLAAAPRKRLLRE